MITVFSQATNDGFVIFFVVIALYFAIQYFYSGGFLSFLALTFTSIGAGLSKGNGLVILPVLLGIFLIRLIQQARQGAWKSARITAVFLSAWIILFGLIVPSFGQYIERYQETGSAFTTNMPIQPLPSLFSYSKVERPGVVSLVDSYFSIPALDLMQNPMVTSQTPKGYTPQRTSFWVQLYGQMNFAHFAAWPFSWQSTSALVRNIGRSIFILALLPTSVAMIWFLRSVLFNLWTLIHKREVDFIALLHVFTIAIYFSFLFLYTWQIRDFATMKPAFLLPAILSMCYFLAGGLDKLFQIAKNRLFRMVAYGALAALLVLFCVDISILIRHLALLLSHTA
jgi:hypothetical protein